MTKRKNRVDTLPGPDTFLDADVQYQICQMVAAGAPLPLACPAVGLKWNTVKDWLKPERADREPYASFQIAVEKARAMHAVGCALRITQAGRKGMWQADLAILERRYGKFFGRWSEGMHNAEDGDPALPEDTDEPLTDAQLERIARGG